MRKNTKKVMSALECPVVGLTPTPVSHPVNYERVMAILARKYGNAVKG